MRNKITYITKLEFLPCFKGAFNAAIIKANIQGGFRGASLVLFNPEVVISTLNVRLRTLPLPTIEDVLWQSQTLSNTLEFRSQSKLIQERIRRHVDSLPIYIVEAIKSLSKGAEIIAHSLVLITKRNAKLQAANEASSKRRSRKRKRVQQQGTLTIEKGVRLTTLKEFKARSNRKKAKKRVRVKVGEPSQRRCRRCGEAGHNARTYKQEAVIDSE
jgi:hypothetical protein